MVIFNAEVMPFDVLLVVVSFHATAHSIALIYTTPAFKLKLVQVLSFPFSAPIFSLVIFYALQMLSIFVPWLERRNSQIPLAASASITATSLTP